MTAGKCGRGQLPPTKVLEEGGMRADDFVVRRRGRHREDRDAPLNLPAPLIRKRADEALLDAKTPEEILEIEQLRLDLDKDERAGGGMEREEVDPTAFAPLAEARLRLDFEPHVPQPQSHRLAERRMLLIGQANEPTCTPEQADIQPEAEHRGVPLQGG